MTRAELEKWAEATAAEVCDGLRGIVVGELEQVIARELAAARIRGLDDALEALDDLEDVPIILIINVLRALYTDPEAPPRG